MSYDALPSRPDQQAVRGEWDRRIAAGLDALHLLDELEAAGVAYAEADAAGRVTLRALTAGA
jgi:hypothetical protein